MVKSRFMVVTALLLLLLAAPVAAFSGAGSGTIDDPYRITTANQFLEIRTDSGYFVLENDIDMTGKTWGAPISRGESATEFRLDGQGHIVKNLVLSGNGMFTITGKRFSIKNVVFESPSLTISGDTDAQAGLIASRASYFITLENVGIVNADFKATTTSVHQGYATVGGLIGKIYSSPTIKNCFVTGTLKAKMKLAGMLPEPAEFTLGKIRPQIRQYRIVILK